MLETALNTFTTFFAVIGPIDTAVLLASLTPNITPGERREIAVKAAFIATIIILIFALVGQPVLTQLGVSLSALQTAGGIILFMIALEMTLAKRPGLLPRCRPRRARRPRTRPRRMPRSRCFRLPLPSSPALGP